PAAVWRLRLLWERPPDAVADEGPPDTEARRLDVALDRDRHVPDAPPRPALGDAELERLPGDVEQAADLVGDLADRQGHRRVGVVPLDDGSEIEPDDVSFAEPAPGRRNSVHDLLVDRGADRGRESPVSLEGRLRVPLPDQILHLAVDLEGRHARLHEIAAHPEGVGQDTASLPHVGNLGGRLELDHRGPSVALTRSAWTTSTVPLPEMVAR